MSLRGERYEHHKTVFLSRRETKVLQKLRSESKEELTQPAITFEAWPGQERASAERGLSRVYTGKRMVFANAKILPTRSEHEQRWDDEYLGIVFVTHLN